jgi:hypothetical protein
MQGTSELIEKGKEHANTPLLAGKSVHPINGPITQRHSGTPFNQEVKVFIKKNPRQRNPRGSAFLRLLPSKVLLLSYPGK